ncbi:MAG: hypothetical protein ACRDAM_17215, partial [Casimicrobium sp.]
PLQAVGAEQAYAAAFSRPFQGRLLREWAQNVGEARMFRVREAIRQGYVQGETIEQIVRRLRGTKAKKYSDGLIDQDRRSIDAVVRTAVSHTARSARESFYDATQRLIKGETWLSTLDGHTTPQCRIRDKKSYSYPEHKPIGHSIPWAAGPGRLHFRCRSTSTVVLKSWKELGGADLPEFSSSTRASMSGQVPASVDYKQWLMRQSSDVQDDVLGVTRARKMRSGEIAFDSMYDRRGRWLTLEELDKRG